MSKTVISLIEQRASVNLFDPSHALPLAEIEELVRLATRAPTAYNFQNWRFIAVHTSQAKARLRRVADNQPKITDAAVTFIICGALPDHAALSQRLQPFVDMNLMPRHVALGWAENARSRYDGQPRTQRDEAIRTATFGAATLILAAQALGLASGAMVGFDPEGVSREFNLGPEEVPVVLLAVGRAAEGNWPQKPRRPLKEILEFQ